jgi:hypothetical protein
VEAPSALHPQHGVRSDARARLGQSGLLRLVLSDTAALRPCLDGGLWSRDAPAGIRRVNSRLTWPKDSGRRSRASWISILKPAGRIRC